MRLLVSMGLRPKGDVRSPMQAVLRQVDWGAKQLLADLALPSSPGSAPQGEDEQLMAAERMGEWLVQPTRSEVLVLGLRDLAVAERWSHPLFCDVHHVLHLPDGGWAVANTGNDSVLLFSADRELLAHHYLGRGSFEQRYEGVEDFRLHLGDRFKPHHHHPNHLLWWRDRLWVTSLAKQRIEPLGAPDEAIPIPHGPPHDGVLREGRVWFTTVNGWVLALDAATGALVQSIDLGALHSTPRRLGWCRGIDVVGDRCFVGMSTLRASRWREMARWAAQGEAGQKLPTRVLEIDLRRERVVAEMAVGNAAGGTIYSVHAV